MTFATPDAKALYLESFDGHGPSEKLENYYSPDQSDEVYCTTEEREDFENANEVAFTADVISDQYDFDRFVRYLTEQRKLQEF